MSQEKVNKYKEYKKNRKEIIAKEKKKKKIERVVGYSVVGIFCATVVGAIGVTVWNEYQAALAAKPNYVKQNYILGDMNAILEEETEESTEELEETTEDEVEESSESETTEDVSEG